MHIGKLAVLAFTLMTMSLVLAACGGADPTATATPPVAPPAGDPAGLQVFIRDASPSCATCHAIDGVDFAVGQIGPNLSDIGSRSDVDFIRESIVNPNAVIAEACPSGPCPDSVMPQNFADTLTAEQLDDLVGYLTSLK